MTFFLRSLVWVILIEVIPHRWRGFDSWFVHNLGQLCHWDLVPRMSRKRTPYFWGFTFLLQWGNWAKNRFGHNFWLGGPIHIRSTRLNCIWQDLFRDIPLDHIWRAQIRAQICQIWPNMLNMHIWPRQIWSSGVSLKRSCKMQFRRIGLRSIGPSSQK